MEGKPTQPAVHTHEHVLHPDALVESAPSSGPRRVLRSTDLKFRRIKALAAAAVIGMAGNAEAGGANQVFKGQAEAAAIGAAIDYAAQKFGLPTQPVVVGADQSGKVRFGMKSPQMIQEEIRRANEQKEMNETFNKPAQFQPGVVEYAASIGITIIDKPGVFVVQSMINPTNQVTAQKYYSPTQNTKLITVEKPAAGGVMVTIFFKKNNIPQTEILTFRTNAQAEMKSASTLIQGVAPQFTNLFTAQ